MTDTLSREDRSRVMAAVKSRNTKPEIKVRKWLHSQGYRFRLHSSKLPGKPDIILPQYKIVIFVHGCFWHGHSGCSLARIPKTRSEWWQSKFDKNAKRDAHNKTSLENLGWRVIVVWECEIKNDTFKSIISEILPPKSSPDISLPNIL